MRVPSDNEICSCGGEIFFRLTVGDERISSCSDCGEEYREDNKPPERITAVSKEGTQLKSFSVKIVGESEGGITHLM